jgi:hypothetical protein
MCDSCLYVDGWFVTPLNSSLALASRVAHPDFPGGELLGHVMDGHEVTKVSKVRFD